MREQVGLVCPSNLTLLSLPAEMRGIAQSRSVLALLGQTRLPICAVRARHDNVSCDSALLLRTGGVLVCSLGVRWVEGSRSAVGHQRDKKAGSQPVIARSE